MTTLWQSELGFGYFFFFHLRKVASSDKLMTEMTHLSNTWEMDEMSLCFNFLNMDKVSDEFSLCTLHPEPSMQATCQTVSFFLSFKSCQ